jgi:hypothetical protein
MAKQRMTMKNFRKELGKMLDRYYGDLDRAIALRNQEDEWNASLTLGTLQHVAEMAEMSPIYRRNCKLATCPVKLPRTHPHSYCSNACKQKAYRIKKGQFRK